MYVTEIITKYTDVYNLYFSLSVINIHSLINIHKHKFLQPDTHSHRCNSHYNIKSHLNINKMSNNIRIKGNRTVLICLVKILSIVTRVDSFDVKRVNINVY